MDKIQKQEFTRRITQSNKGGLIVVTYDICFAYVKDAKEAFENQDTQAFAKALHKSMEVVTRLRDGLDFQYTISKELYPLYQFVLEQMSKCFYQNNTEGLINAETVLNNLYAGFVEAAKQDNSEPLMRNTQQVVAGMTYQRGSLTEILQGSDSSRGFFA